MPHRRIGLSFLVLALALATFVGTQILSRPNDAQATRVNPEDVCPSGGIKDEEAPWEAEVECPPPIEGAPDGTSGEGVVIISAVVKAGNDTHEFTEEGVVTTTEDGVVSVSSVNDCYTVTGLGTCHVTVTGGGTGSDCREISHVVFCTREL